MFEFLKKKKARSRDPSLAMVSVDDWSSILCDGYTPLSKCPQVVGAVKKIAGLAALCTIHLMENTESGDKRLQNGISRMVDIDVNDYQSRYDFISCLVRTLLLEGDGNALVLPETKDGYLRALHLVPPSSVSFHGIPGNPFDYKILVGGKKVDRDEVVHIRLNPDPDRPWLGLGYTAELRDVVKSLKQDRRTKDAFMESKWKPSVIVKVDGLVEEFSTEEGRKKILESYVKNQDAGQPWLIPADGFDVTTVKPLSLQDLAIKDGLELDAREVAAILDVPPFFVGVGTFNAAEFNNFVQSRLPQILAPIEQALTKQLLISPSWYFRFNARSLLNYDIQTLASVGTTLRQIGVMDGNEVRDMLGLSPREGLDELVLLENYLPADRLGDQKKLKEGGDSDGTENSSEQGGS